MIVNYYMVSHPYRVGSIVVGIDGQGRARAVFDIFGHILRWWDEHPPAFISAGYPLAVPVWGSVNNLVGFQVNYENIN